MASVNRTEIARALARLAGITGELPELQLPGDLLPVVNALNLDDAPFHFKRGGYFSLNHTSAVGTFPTLTVGLPASNRNGVVVVRYLAVLARGVDIGIQLTYRTSVWIGGIGLQAALDWDARSQFESTGDRHSGSPIEFRAGNHGALFTTPFAVDAVRNNQRITIPGPFVLRGDASLVLQATSAADVTMGAYADYYD